MAGVDVTTRPLSSKGRQTQRSIEAAARKLFAERGVEAVIICFMFSFLNPKHEMAAKKIVQQELPNVYLSTSCEVIDVIREY